MIVLVDIDHVISDAGWRDSMLGGIHSWDEYHGAASEDLPVEEMVSLVNCLSVAGHEVIGFTARPERWRKMTMDWMILHGVNLSDVLMRGDDDFRAADKIKMELVEKSLEGRAIDLVIDDNEAVCAAFRAKGITTLYVSVRGAVR